MKAQPWFFAAMIGSITAGAYAQSVTYDFTGTVNSTSGSVGSLTVGSTVSGTYTFDFAAGVPSVSSGTLGDQSGEWYVQDEGGSSSTYPTPTASVFSDTLSGGGFSFSSGPIGSVLSDTYVLGFGSSFSPSYITSAINNYSFNTGALNSSGIALLDYGSNFNVPYTSAGLPIVSNAAFFSTTGYVQLQDSSGTFDAVNYTITSLTSVSAVPEPSTYLSMLVGLGMVGLLLAAKKKSGYAM